MIGNLFYYMLKEYSDDWEYVLLHAYKSRAVDLIKTLYRMNSYYIHT